MKRIFLLFWIISASLSAISQNAPQSFESTFEEALILTEENLHPQALEKWLELHSIAPENNMVNYRVGVAYLNSFSNKTDAMPYLAQSVENGIDKNFNPVSPFMDKPPREAYFHLGRAYHLNYKLDSAITSYNKFMELASSKHHLTERARQGIDWAKSAKKLTDNPRDYEITNLGSTINSRFPDFSPVISVDENALFFTSRRLRDDSSNFGNIEPQTGEYFEDIYVSYKNREGEWQEPELLNINGPGHNATVNVSVDGQTLYIYRDDNGDGNIYESKLVGETWTEPEKMGDMVNSKAWETHVAVSADGETIYFVSDRKGGLGGRDIYRTVKLPNDEWSKPLNLGPTVNTPLGEDAVFISPDGRTLYFSSEGHNSMGGFDIFTTTLQDDDTWSEPENIGYPLNTVQNDVFFVTSADGQRGYFSSAKSESFGEKDIYTVKLPERELEEGLAVLKGFVVPPEGESLPDNTSIYVTNNQTGETRSYQPRSRDGVFVAILPPCVEYNIDYRVNGESIHSEYVSVPCDAAYQEINKEIMLDPVNLGDSRVTTISGDENVGETVKQTKVTEGDTTTVTTKQGEEEYVTQTPAGTTVFDKKYGYNEMDVNLEASRFILFMNDIAEMVKSQESIDVTIEGSASKVPTSTYNTNQNLADLRAKRGRSKFMQALKAKGIDTSKVNISSSEGKVQGPNYAGDYKNEEKYRPYQYLKITAR